MAELNDYELHELSSRAVIARAGIPEHLVLPDADGFNPYADWPHGQVGIDIRVYKPTRDAWSIATPLRDWRYQALHMSRGRRFITLAVESHGWSSTPTAWAYWDDPEWREYRESSRPNQSARPIKGANIGPDFYRWLDQHLDLEDL